MYNFISKHAFKNSYEVVQKIVLNKTMHILRASGVFLVALFEDLKRYRAWVEKQAVTPKLLMVGR